VIIGLWQLRNRCPMPIPTICYHVPAPLDVAIVAAAAMGGCIGFLWWNARPHG
jgi:phospho-N-acetylmuramoyl-pentapeptide-transferase